MPDPFVGQELQTVVATLQNMVVGISNLTKGLASFTPAQASHDPLMGVPAWPTPNFYQKLTHVTAAGNYQIHSQACILWGFTLNNAANKATMTVYDGIGGGTVLANFDVAIQEAPYPLPGGGWYLRTGLYVVVTSAPDLTFISASRSGS